MANQVEPPVLLSRLMGFVLATALVVLGALGYTLWHMFPLNRPQVFFLMTERRSEMDIALYPMQLTSNERNKRNYVIAFVKEYIKARYETVSDIGIMQRKWGSSDGGIVHAWSTQDVYNDFASLQRVEQMLYRDSDIDATCTVEFAPGNNPREYTKDKKRWIVTFKYLCQNSTGPSTQKDYTIILDIQLEDKTGTTKIKYGDRIENPLGIRVDGYSIQDGNTDPLDMKLRETPQEM